MCSAALSSLQSEYGSDYPRALARSSLLLDLLARDVSRVAPSVEEAIVARWPRTTYQLGIDSSLFVAVADYLPAWINDLACLIVLGYPKPQAIKQRRANTMKSETDKQN